MRILILYLLLCAAAFGQSTKVSGSGATKVGGSGTTKVYPTSAGTASATDNFTRTNANPISNPMSDGVSTWTTSTLDGGSSGILQIVSNTARGTIDSVDNFGKVVSPTFTGKHYAEMTVVSQAGSDYDGPCVCIQSGTSNCYFAQFQGSPTTIFLGIRTSNVNSLLQSFTVASVIAGDKIRLRRDGTSLILSINGVDQSPTVTDATYSGGQPGINVGATGTQIGTVTFADF